MSQQPEFSPQPYEPPAPAQSEVSPQPPESPAPEPYENWLDRLLSEVSGPSFLPAAATVLLKDLHERLSRIEHGSAG